MNHKPYDFLIGCIVVAVVVGASVFAAGPIVLINWVWAISYGFLIVFLLKTKRRSATILAIILMPLLLFRYFLPKKLRTQLEQAETKEKNST
jgi:hypothetical protein